MEDNKKEDKVLPNNVSAVRFMMNEAFSLNTKFLKNFDEAKSTDDAVVIMEGDWGGQIYLVCRMELVKCDFETLELLLNDLDDIAWSCNKGEGKGVFFEVRKVGEGISGGMGGGNVHMNLWVHKEFKEKGLEDEIKQVISGQKKRLTK